MDVGCTVALIGEVRVAGSGSVLDSGKGFGSTHRERVETQFYTVLLVHRRFYGVVLHSLAIY